MTNNRELDGESSPQDEWFLGKAQQRVEEALDIVYEKRRGYARFQEALEEIETDVVIQPTPTVHQRDLQQSPTGSTVRSVLDAYVDHVGEYLYQSMETREEIYEAIAREFSPELASSLATADSEGQFPPPLKEGLLSGINARRKELASARVALNSESASLTEIDDSLTRIHSQLEEISRQSIEESSFNDLVDEYEELDSCIDELDVLAEQRQRELKTGIDTSWLTINHDEFVDKLYGDLVVNRPALSDIASMARRCHRLKRDIEVQLMRL